MARTLITPVPMPGPYVYPAMGQLALQLVVCDSANGNYFPSSGKDVVTFYCQNAQYIWDSTTTYNPGDIVQLSFNSPNLFFTNPPQYFTCKARNTNVPPVADVQSGGANWSVYEGETFTIRSMPDPFNRSGDIGPYLVFPGTVAIYYLVSLGWMQADGNVYFDTSSDRMMAAICPIPK